MRITDDEIKAAAKAAAAKWKAAGWEPTPGLMAELARIVSEPTTDGHGGPRQVRHADGHGGDGQAVD
jgi:hypothetical protein